MYLGHLFGHYVVPMKSSSHSRSFSPQLPLAVLGQQQTRTLLINQACKVITLPGTETSVLLRVGMAQRGVGLQTPSFPATDPPSLPKRRNSIKCSLDLYLGTGCNSGERTSHLGVNWPSYTFLSPGNDSI